VRQQERPGVRALRPEKVDRRAEYYARAATVIASDPLDFYTRAERGRRWLLSRPWARNPPPTISLASLLAIARAITHHPDSETA
jgi:hypothetical protein